VSDEALAKADQLLHPEENHNKSSLAAAAPLMKSTMSLFSTAGSGRPLEVSSEYLPKADEILQWGPEMQRPPAALERTLGQRIESTGASNTLNDTISTTAASVPKSTTFLFSTAGSGQPEVVSSEAPTKPDEILQRGPANDADKTIPLHHTPYSPGIRPANLVTRSTGIGNPYQRKRKHGEVVNTESSSSCRPDIRWRPSDAFHCTTDIQGTPGTAVDISDDRRLEDNHSLAETNPKCVEPSSNKNPPSTSFKFSFSPLGKKMQLSEFSIRYGPMTSEANDCIKLGVLSIVLRISADNASKLRFDSDGHPHSLFGERSGYQGVLHGSIVDLRKQLLLRGCSDSIISDMWLNNHYRWVCWKLAAMERRFPRFLAGNYLTFEHVILQLHQRYNKELGDGNRPILRRILNRDFAPSQSMVLCVSKIIKRKRLPETTGKSEIHAEVSINSSDDEIIIELTDGWYSIVATMDHFLQDRVRKGKIAVGCKLMVSNAALEGAEDGIDPLDPIYLSAMRSLTVRLKICANSTRLCKWTAKLGLVKSKDTLYGGLFRIKSLSDIVRGGGSIPLLFLVVCKRFPILFMEQTGCKNTDACKILSVEEEEYRAHAQQKRLERFIDDITDEAQEKATKVCRFIFLMYIITLINFTLIYLFFLLFCSFVRRRMSKTLHRLHGS
jgi:hypothetical protein